MRGARDTSRWAICRVRLAWHIDGVNVEIMGNSGVYELVNVSEGFIGRRMPVTSIGPAFNDSRVATVDDEG